MNGKPILHRRRRIAIYGTLIMMIYPACFPGCASQAPVLTWQKLAPIPDPEGFAGAFAGVSGDVLILAGGANIPSNKWGETFHKKWYDSVFVLEQPGGSWQRATPLPHPLGYGVSVSTHDGLVCIGGGDENRQYAEVFSLRWHDGKLAFKSLPSLPRPCANLCGALVGHTIYVAGGIETPSATRALKTFWKLDLKRLDAGWTKLEPWPGPERMFAVAGSDQGSFYLFSGVKLRAGPDGKAVREYLRDGYRFTPGSGWKRLTDLPRPVAAAPSPAPSAGRFLFVLTGDDGTKVDFLPLTEHPGFPRDVLAFDTQNNTWSEDGETPFSRATAPVAPWRGQFVVLNGEVRPRERTPEVWSAKFVAP
ncbi:MAG TPA: galactose oxidase [Verrucomicrobiae bacterium]|nr:galactose oxidase [Verrucomicrobiae bacterium]